MPIVELAGTLKAVRGRAGRAEDPSPIYEAIVVFSSPAAFGALGEMIGQEVRAEIFMPQLPLSSAFRPTPLEEAIADQDGADITADDTNGTQVQRRPSRRRSVAPTEDGP